MHPTKPNMKAAKIWPGKTPITSAMPPHVLAWSCPSGATLCCCYLTAFTLLAYSVQHVSHSFGCLQWSPTLTTGATTSCSSNLTAAWPSELEAGRAANSSEGERRHVRQHSLDMTVGFQMPLCAAGVSQTLLGQQPLLRAAALCICLSLLSSISRVQAQTVLWRRGSLQPACSSPERQVWA